MNSESVRGGADTHVDAFAEDGAPHAGDAGADTRPRYEPVRMHNDHVVLVVDDVLAIGPRLPREGQREAPRVPTPITGTETSPMTLT